MWGRLRVLLCACLMAGGVVMVAPPVEGATDPAPFSSWSEWVDRLYRDLLKAALTAALKADVAVTDDCAAVERLGKEVYLAQGSQENIKITTPLDLEIAEAILRRREEA